MSKVSFCIGIAAIMLAAASPLSAQGLRLGVKGGVVSSTIRGGDVGSDSESLARFGGGVSLELGVTQLLSIQPELLYTLKGARAFGDDIRLSYFEVPVLAKLTFGASALRPSLFAGPAISFKSSCEVEFGGEPGAVECGDESEGTVDVKDTDFGAVFGAEVGYGLGLAQLLVDGRINLGLSTLGDAADDFDFKNRTFSLLVGLSFPLGGR